MRLLLMLGLTFISSSLYSLDILFVKIADTLRKRAWPRLVGLDFNLEPMAPLGNMNNGSEINEATTTASSATTPSAPRFEIDTTELKKKSDETM